ncbi:MAG: hypothetical protein FD123_1121 [Bacteroidetes bacterium]|nr:MAG: hypothetical protein FD123_1121 [Bacteroidota bacterium]
MKRIQPLRPGYSFDLTGIAVSFTAGTGKKEDNPPETGFIP